MNTSLKQIDSLNSEHGYLEKQLGSLEAASRPRKDELDRLDELKKTISTEEKEIERLIQGSKKLRDKVHWEFILFIHASFNPDIFGYLDNR